MIKNILNNRLKLFTIFLSISVLFLEGQSLFNNNLFFVGLGPAWSNFDSLVSYDYKNVNTTTKLDSQYKINIAKGYQLSTFLVLYVNDYCIPYFHYIHSSLNNGNGILQSYNVQNGKFIDLVECHDFTPKIKSDYFAVGDYIKIHERKLFDRLLTLYFFAGYNIEKTKSRADWTDDFSISCSTWYGAALGVSADYNLSQNITLWLGEYIYPDRINIVSTRNSLLGENAGFESFIYFSNYLTTSLIYNLQHNQNASLGITFGYFLSRNISQANIVLSETDSNTFTNPKLHFEKSNYFVFLFDFLVDF